MSRRTRKSVKASCDRAWSQLIRSKGSCEWCGGGADNAHHVIGRNNHRLRFEPRNGCCLCFACHRRVHDNPLEFAEWVRTHRPEDVAFLALECRKGLIKRDLQDYLDLEQSLRDLLAACASSV